MVVLRDARNADIASITAIYNDAVANSTAIWNERTVDEGDRMRWWAEHLDRGYPVIVATDDQDEVLGYGTFGDWRNFDGYRFTVEHSLYVRLDARGQGVGKLMLEELIERARGVGKHVMVAGIESENEASIRLHRKLGFTNSGTLTEVGTKFGRWLDLTFMQLTL